jgi:hypothetical protein
MREFHSRRSQRIHRRLDALRAEFRSLPVVDDRTSDDIIGYECVRDDFVHTDIEVLRPPHHPPR